MQFVGPVEDADTFGVSGIKRPGVRVALRIGLYGNSSEGHFPTLFGSERCVGGAVELHLEGR